MDLSKLVIRKQLILLLGVLLLISSVGFSQTEKRIVKIKVRLANIREKPSLKSDTLAQVKRGTVLQVDGKEGEWYSIRLPLEVEGYALPGYIHDSIVEEIVKFIEDIPPPNIIMYEEGKTAEPLFRSGVGFEAGYAALSNGNYGGGLKLGASFTYKLSETLALELKIQTFKSDVERDDDELDRGKLSITPIQLSLQGRFPSKSRLVPYVLGGIGYYLNSFTHKTTIPGFSINEMKNAIGVHLGAGVEYFFKETLGVSLDVRYCLVKTKADWTMTTDPVTSGEMDGINLNAILIGVGAKYFF
ncbi:OmpW family outer membrane protein [Acidobacteriota bacterium]